MYRIFEEKYKKDLTLNKLIRALNFISVISYFIIILSFVFKFYIGVLIAIIFCLVSLIFSFYFILNVKFTIKLHEYLKKVRDACDAKYNENIHMFVDILVENDWYNVGNVMNIVEHYRHLIVPKTTRINFFEIVSFVVAIVAILVGLMEYTIDIVFSVAVILVIIFVGCLFIYIIITKLRKMYNEIIGEENINEMLESIFSEILANLLNENCIEMSNSLTPKKNLVHKVKGKKKRKK